MLEDCDIGIEVQWKGRRGRPKMRCMVRGFAKLKKSPKKLG